MMMMPSVVRHSTRKAGSSQRTPSAESGAYTSDTPIRVFERDAPDQPVYFVAEADQVFHQIATVLSGDSCDESLFCHNSLLGKEEKI